VARRPIVVLTATVVVLTGCSTVDSADVRTSGLTGNVVASVPEGASYTDVDASLTVGTLTFVQLGDGEKLTASAGGKSVTLKRQKISGATSYRGRLAGVKDAGTEIVIDLQRDGDNTSAPRSAVRLPETVSLEAPAAGAGFSRARDDIRVRIASPSKLPAILTWAGPCIVAGSIDLEPGRTDVTISRGTLKPLTPSSTGATPPPASAATCQISLTVTRRSDGVLDPAFKNGSIRAESQSTRQVTSAP
jgi:hypothetical protein